MTPSSEVTGHPSPRCSAVNKMVTALAATLLAVGLAPTATAVAPPPTEDTRLHLTAARTQGETEAIGNVWLDCPASDRPAHPHRKEACAALDAAAGDLDRLNTEPDATCTAEYAPVTLTARGTYKGRTVDWTKTYGNNCEATVATGAVFSF
ncbi:SSI family serine proteinase inhibitor [Streptomyces sp. NBC_01255]|uniref:SSI family serine proteinase inhibitor n=1 Tax=Streptomyces sp. NBC_01255 TaxID=2903798 RepID=UPI002E352B98|nr:SSI family serine proteinase inhibitor [Streptomyces sp. NBC_01255]